MCVPSDVDDEWPGSCVTELEELDREASHTHSGEMSQNDEKGRGEAGATRTYLEPGVEGKVSASNCLPPASHPPRV